MIRAILEGQKTQTRRIVKHQRDMEFDVNDPTYGPYWLSYATEADGEDAKVRCPYGKPTERLWVRESWAAPHGFDAWSPRDIPKAARIYYSATADLKGPCGVGGLRCRPSIFMPRWASRITLEITAVRVERLQSISEADARAEGVKPNAFEQTSDNWGGVLYRRLWEQINGPGSWDANPWVWVVEFRRLLP
jgi:hypothetical protein